MIPDVFVSKCGCGGGSLLIVKNVLVNAFYVFSESAIAVHSECHWSVKILLGRQAGSFLHL